MLNEKEIKLHARLGAIENLLTLFMAMQLVQSGYQEDTAASLMTGLTNRMRSQTFEGTDAATSDLLASEVEAATADLTEIVLSRVAGLRSRLGG